MRGAAPGRWLALDVGERRVGIAISDPTGLLASPLATLHRKSKLEDFQRIARLVQEREAIGLVVGWPLHMNGTESPQARRVRRYSEALKATLRDQGFEGPVVLWDERLSTQTAEERLREAGARPARRRAEIDAAAAAVILQEFLDSDTKQGEGL